MSEIGFLTGSIDDEHQPVLDARCHQIIENAAGTVEQQRVAHPPGDERLQIAGDKRLQRRRRLYTT